MARLLIALTFMLSGCSEAFVERMSSGALQDWHEDQPFVIEHLNGINDHFGYGKRLIVGNPLDVAIEARIECESMYQADLTAVHVGPKRERYFMITASRNYGQACYLTGFKVVP